MKSAMRSADSLLAAYSFELGCLITKGRQTNPTIKAFIGKLGEKDDANVDTRPRFWVKSKQEEYEAMESGFLREEVVAQINKGLNKADFSDMYRPLDEPNRMRTTDQTMHKTRIQMELERHDEERKMEIQRRDRIQRERKERLRKATTIKELRDGEREHLQFLEKQLGHRFVQERAPAADELAREKRQKQIKFGDMTLAENRKIIPNTPKPERGRPKKEVKAPPHAADLENFEARINAEVKELEAFSDFMFHDFKVEVDVANSMKMLDGFDVVVDEQAPDFHLNLAMMFQKLEDAEQRIQELSEKAEMMT